jgi:phenylalanyl-tRNA synthetase alpha subunit
MVRYPFIQPGERVQIKWRKEDFKLACCDCGLVHKLRFTIKGGVLTIRGWRDNRATGQLRRKARGKA